jgi:hypothetical protein
METGRLEKKEAPVHPHKRFFRPGVKQRPYFRSIVGISALD